MGRKKKILLYDNIKSVWEIRRSLYQTELSLKDFMVKWLKNQRESDKIRLWRKAARITRPIEFYGVMDCYQYVTTNNPVIIKSKYKHRWGFVGD